MPTGRVGGAARSASMEAGTTLLRVEAPEQPLDELAGVVAESLLEQVRDAARVLHVNATAHGGGVAELLSSEVALMAGLGLRAEWRLICPDERLFAVTKRIHNAMQGQQVELSRSDWDVYLRHNEHCAAMLADEWDVVVVHDPQPAALISANPAPGARWIWRCHIDTSTPDPEVWAALRAHVLRHDEFVFTLDAFRPPDLEAARTHQIAPAIDPHSPKNRPLPPQASNELVRSAGVDPVRPLIVQVSRFDPWKDPLGVIAAWRLAREAIPGLQLALVGAMADDDPEGWPICAEASEAAAGEDDVHLLTNLQGIGAVEVNAFQREADVVIQKSLREGFGLTVSEALWKGTPVVGGRAGGIPMQLGDDEGGIVVDDVEGCARAIATLLREPALRRAKGRAGRERVRRDFLVARLLRDDLRLYAHAFTGTRGHALEGGHS